MIPPQTAQQGCQARRKWIDTYAWAIFLALLTAIALCAPSAHQIRTALLAIAVPTHSYRTVSREWAGQRLPRI